MKLVFINGLGGTGKTEVVNYFKKNHLKGWLFFDFDQGKYPIPNEKLAIKEWWKKQHIWFLEECLRIQSIDKINICIMGVSLFPWDLRVLEEKGEIINKNISQYAYLYCNPEIRKLRLEARGDAHLFEGDLEKYKVVIEKFNKEGAKSFDTSYKSVDKVADDIAVWLKSL